MKLAYWTLAFSFAAASAAEPQIPCPLAKQCCPEVFKPDGVVYGFYGQCLVLQPNGSDLYYGVEADGLDESLSFPAVSPNWTVLEIDPNYHPGFEVGFNLFSEDHNLEVNLNWERMHSNDNDSFLAPPANGYMVGPFFDIGPNSVSYKLATGKLTSHFDEVNLTFGRRLCFFNNFATQFYAGAGFTRIQQTMFSSYANATQTLSRSVNNSSTFTGAGPQIGLDYEYRIYDEFFLKGNSVFSLLVGQSQNNTTFESYSPILTTFGVPQPNTQQTVVPNRTQLVPGFEQRLGFSYLAVWDSIRALFEVGYQCQIYINAVQTVDMTAPQVIPALVGVFPDVGVFAVGFERTMSNYILTGPYASIGLEF